MRLPLLMIVSLTSAGFAASQSNDRLDLSGEWRLALDAGDTGLSAGPSTWRLDDVISLPNTLTLAGKGEVLKSEPRLNKETLANLHQRFSHGGPAWYQRDLDVPSGWAGKDINFEI